MLTDSNRLSCVFLAAGNSAGIFTALLCPSADFLSLWMDSPGASQPQHWESGFFFCPSRPAVPWCVQQFSEVSFENPEPSTFGSGSVSCHLFAVEVLAIFETPSISLGYITYFFLFTWTLWLWSGCDWTNISPPETACRLENEIWCDILRTEPWPPLITSVQSWDARCCFPRSCAWSTCSYHSRFSSCGDSV